MIDCCPECSGTQVESRNANSMFKTESKTANREKYYCRECQTRFDTLDQREPKNGATINAGLAAKLDKMDPEDL